MGNIIVTYIFLEEILFCLFGHCCPKDLSGSDIVGCIVMKVARFVKYPSPSLRTSCTYVFSRICATSNSVSVVPFTMAFHDKAKKFYYKANNGHEEYMGQLLQKIKRAPDTRNTRRHNQRLVAKITGKLGQRPSALISYNMAELYYNGTVGIPSDVSKAMAYYVTTWETVVATHRNIPDVLIATLNNNMDEVCHVIETEALRKFADRLHAAYDKTPIPELELIATMFSARVADMMGSNTTSIGLYREAKAIAQSVGDKRLALECSKRKAVLKAVGQHKLDKVIEKYAARSKELDVDDPMVLHSTPGVFSTQRRDSFTVWFEDKQARENFKAKMAAMGMVVCAEHSDVSVRLCAACDKPDFEKVFKACSRCLAPRYCSKKCQKEHWPEHKRHCCSKN